MLSHLMITGLCSTWAAAACYTLTEKGQKMEKTTSICPSVSQRDGWKADVVRVKEGEETENELFHLRVRVEKARLDSIDGVYS